MQQGLFNEYANRSSVPSPVNRMMADFSENFREGVDINLGIGYVNERTIPRNLIIEATQNVLSDPKKYKTPLNYGGSKGSENLIESIRKYFADVQSGFVSKAIIDQKNIIIGSNGATSILESIAAIHKPKVVITSDPMYYIYSNFLLRLGYQLVTIPEDEHGIQPEILDHRLVDLQQSGAEISYFYFTTIGNPSSSILSNARRKHLVEIVTNFCKTQNRKIPLILDKAYEDIVHDPTVGTLISGFAWDELGIVYEVGTLSKIIAPALRIGYMMGPSGPLMDALVQRTNDVGFSASLINQEIAGYIIDHFLKSQKERVNGEYAQKAVTIKQALMDYLDDEIESCIGGKAGFYFYLTFKQTKTIEGSPFFKFLSRKTGNAKLDGESVQLNPRVLYLPGEFCVNPEGDMREVSKRQLRISYGFEETDRIIESIRYLKEAVEYAKAVCG